MLTPDEEMPLYSMEDALLSSTSIFWASLLESWDKGYEKKKKKQQVASLFLVNPKRSTAVTGLEARSGARPSRLGVFSVSGVGCLDRAGDPAVAPFLTPFLGGRAPLLK